MNRIRHNYPSLIRCLRVFHILVLAYLLFRCYCYNHYKIPKTLLLLSLLLLPLPPLSYYFATKHFAADTKFPGVVELTTQLLILENILWLPLCRINKFGLNTLPSKIVAIPYTCGLSRPFYGAIAGEHNYICWVTWDLYLFITMKYLKHQRTKIFPSTMRGGKELPSSLLKTEGESSAELDGSSLPPLVVEG